MKRLFLSWMWLLAAVGAAGSCFPSKQDEMGKETIKLTVGDKSFSATLADNSSARALKDLLAKGDLTIRMEDYAGMEKVGPSARLFRVTTGR